LFEQDIFGTILVFNFNNDFKQVSAFNDLSNFRAQYLC